jgi:hypothetical protein
MTFHSLDVNDKTEFETSNAVAKPVARLGF